MPKNTDRTTRRSPNSGLAAYQSDVSDKKRAAIVDGARACFVEFGYSSVSMQQIAERAEVSTATVYKHFSSKADIFNAVVIHVYAAFGSTLVPNVDDLPSEQGLTLIAEDFMLLQEKLGLDALMRSAAGEATADPALGSHLLRQGLNPRMKDLANYLRTQTDRGRLQIQDIPLAVLQFTGLINEAFFWPRLLDASHTLSKRKRNVLVREAVAMFLSRYGTSP